MTLLGTVVVTWAVAGCAAWAIGLVLSGWVVGRIPALPQRLPPDDPTSWPSVSVIVPACDEVDTLAAAAATLLAQDYPGDLELVLVDDRSTDGTSELVDRIAGADERVRAVHVEELPDGWLGKVHALRQGAAASSGTWVLLTDADVHLSPGALRRAVAYAVTRGAEHLALVPDTRSPSPWARAAMLSFLSIYLLRFQCHAAADPDRPEAAGVGAFNLVKRSALREAAAFEAVRLEIADDVGLAMVLSRAGHRSCVALAIEDVVVDWYPSLPAMLRGLEKNFFAAAAGYRVWLGLLGSISVFMGWLTPWVVLAQPWAPAARWALVVVLVAMLYQAVRHAAALKMPIPRVFLSHLVGAPVLAWALWRSTWKGARTGVVTWRGTSYAVSELRRGRVLDL